MGRLAAVSIFGDQNYRQPTAGRRAGFQSGLMLYILGLKVAIPIFAMAGKKQKGKQVGPKSKNQRKAVA